MYLLTFIHLWNQTISNYYLQKEGQLLNDKLTDMIYFLTKIFPNIPVEEIEKIWSRMKFPKSNLYKKSLKNENITFARAFKRFKNDISVIHVYFDSPVLLKAEKIPRATFMDKVKYIFGCPAAL